MVAVGTDARLGFVYSPPLDNATRSYGSDIGNSKRDRRGGPPVEVLHVAPQFVLGAERTLRQPSCSRSPGAFFERSRTSLTAPTLGARAESGDVVVVAHKPVGLARAVKETHVEHAEVSDDKLCANRLLG